MLIINCTQSAQEFFTTTRKKQNYSPVQEAHSKDFTQDKLWIKNPMGNPPDILEQWLVHAVVKNGKKVLIALSLSSRYGIVFVGIRKGDHQTFLTRLKQHLSHFLYTQAHNLQLNTTITEQQIAANFEKNNAEVLWLKRGDRSAQAHINSISQQLDYKGLADFESAPDHFYLLINAFSKSTAASREGKSISKSYFAPELSLLCEYGLRYMALTDTLLKKAQQQHRAYVSKRLDEMMLAQLKSDISLRHSSSYHNEKKLLQAGITADDILFIDDILDRYRSDTSLFNLAELDGFLTAIVSGEHNVMPSSWFTAIWGSPDEQPEWESEADVKRFMSLLMTLMNINAKLLMEQPEHFHAIFCYEKNDDIHYVTEWCAGYYRAMLLDPASWFNTPEELKIPLGQIVLFGSEDSDDELSRLTEKQYRSLQQKVEPAARTIHLYWLAQRAGQNTPAKPRHTAKILPFIAPDKTGRNEPCPCGSGKKYKKCCGAH
jgi:uncharacterized protein